MADYNEILLRFFRDDIGGALITDASGAVLYSDRRSDFIRNEKNQLGFSLPAAPAGPESGSLGPDLRLRR